MADSNIINYTSLSFTDLQTDIITFITQQSEFTDQNRQGGNLQLLTKLFAYVTTLLSYNLNQGINETYLDTAQVRSNILKIVKILNYVPTRKQSSQVYVDLSSIVASPNYLVKYDSILSAGKKFYYTGETTDLGVSTSYSDVLFYEGTFTQLLEAYTGTGIPLQTFTIEDTEVGEYFKWFLYDTVNLTKTYWEEFDPTTIYTDPTNAEIFFIKEVDNGYEISCGNDKLGKSFPVGSVFGYEYLKPSAPADTNDLTTFVWDSGTFITDATVALNSSNVASYAGEERESEESIKFIAPKFNVTQGRAVIESDYYALMITHPWIDNAAVIGGDKLVPIELGKVYITVKPKVAVIGDIYFTADQLTTLRDYMLDYSVVTINPIVRNPKYIYLELTSTLRYTTVVQPSKSIVATNVASFINISNDNFGEYLEFSKLEAIVDGSDTLITSSLNSLKKYALITSDNYVELDGDGFYYETNQYNIQLTKYLDTSFTTTIKEYTSAGVLVQTWTEGTDYSITYPEDPGSYGTTGTVLVTFNATGFTLGISQTGGTVNEFRMYFDTADNDIFLNNGQLFTIDENEIISGISLQKVTIQ